MWQRGFRLDFVIRPRPSATCFISHSVHLRAASTGAASRSSAIRYGGVHMRSAALRLLSTAALLLSALGRTDPQPLTAISRCALHAGDGLWLAPGSLKDVNATLVAARNAERCDRRYGELLASVLTWRSLAPEGRGARPEPRGRGLPRRRVSAACARFRARS